MNRKFEGVWIPKEIWFAKDLSIIEKFLLTEIKSLDNEKGCFASNSYFSKFFDVSPATITRSVAKLSDKGLIKCRMETTAKGSQRVINVDPRVYSKCVEGGKHFEEGGCSHFDDHNNTIVNNKNEQSSNNDQIEIQIKPTFEDFWDLYAKKTGKEKCARAWKKLPQKTKELIMERLPDYIASTPDKKYRKDPYTYLNNKCWEDEIIVSNQEKASHFYEQARNHGKGLGLFE